MDISVIIPVYNEEDNVDALYARMTQVLSAITNDYELLFVNDGSRDKTLLKVMTLAERDPKVRYIDFSRNFGHQVAVSAGLDHAFGDAVVIIDADLQDPPELIADMYKLLQSGYEVVYAKRKKRKGESWFKLFTAKLFYRILNRWATIDIPLDTGDFRIMSQSIVRVLRQMPEKHKFLRGQISWIGFRQTFVEYERDARFAGETKYPFRKMLRFAIDGITGFSTVPLKLVSLLGFLSSGLAFLLILWVIFVRVFGRSFDITVQLGWSSTMITVLFLGGIQLIGIGILGEYIARINDNIKDRPLYIIRHKSEALRQYEPAQGVE
jgi:dolichol-phosphate mannosyltransferase